MRTTRLKYLLFDHGGVLDGSLTDKIPSSDDLLLFKIDEGLYQILENGVEIVNILNTLMSRYGYKIGFHSKCNEDEQLRILDALTEACAQKRLEFPKVSVMAVRDSEFFLRIPSHSPVIIKDRRHGIWIAGYDLELDEKVCTRQALSQLLGISETNRSDHVIFDDGENIIKQAKIEGWRTFLINERLSLLKALKQIVHQEEESSSSRQKEPISLIPRRVSLRQESPLIGGDREFKNIRKEEFNRPREPVRLIPSRSWLRQEDNLLRRDREFQNLQKEVLNRQREPISLLQNRHPLLQEDLVRQERESQYAQKTEFSRQREPILTIPNRPSLSQQKDIIRRVQNVQKEELNRQREPIPLIPSRPLLRQAATLPERDRDFQNVQKEEFNRQREPVLTIPYNPPLLQQKDILRRGFSAQYAQQTEFSRQREPSPNRPPLWQESIIRRDREFRNTHKPRLGGSSFSSGIFIGQNGKEWIGKSDVADEKLSEAMACKEKIAGNIYAYYGANVPRMEISRQRFTNTGLGEDEEKDHYAIHVMSELLSNFKTYQKAIGEHFRLKRPNPDQHVRFSDGHTLPERGLGHILAVAALINDVDVIGASGGNIGFQEEIEENGVLYAKTVKIDPGEAFNLDLSLQGYRSVRVALPEERKGDSQLAFDDLPLGTQREFLMTLHEIVKTPEATFRGFFTCRGAHAFILHYNETVESMNKFLVTRQKQLLKDYHKDLERSALFYEEWTDKMKIGLSPEDKARIQEANAVQEQLFFYIPVDVEKQNQRISLLAAIEPILREEGSSRVVLVKGPAGAGKSLSLLHLEQLLLKQRRENKNEPMPIYVDLKRFNTETVEHSFSFVLKEKYCLDPQTIRQEKIIVLMDGYDEISGGCQKNLYQCQQLDQWPKLKMIISCRSQYLTSEYRDWFTPSLRGEDLEEFELLPFTPDQINQYLKRYAETGRREYSLKEYQENIKGIPNLSALITNPFILRILVESLPELMKQVQNGKGVNRYSVYEAFMRSWFIKQERRLSQSFDLPDDWNAIKAFEDFSKALALTLHIHQKVETEAQDAFWGPFFSSSAADAIRARSGCPLQRVRDHCYSFIHKSFLEYFAAKAIIEEALKPVSVVQPSHIIQELSVIDFFEDILELSPEIRQDLVKQIMKSRNNRDLGKSAANAITLLNAVRHSFSGMDLNQIQIPGAVLDYGFFDSANFTEANLQGVSFKRSWLYYANFQKASMSGVLFGERPFLEFPEEVTACCYSHDGKWLAVAAWEEIFLLDHKRLTLVRSFKEERKITSLSFSHNDQVIASLTTNGTISLWDVNTGKQKQRLKGDFKHAKSISFSPNGQKLASGRENYIYLWEVNNDEAKHCLELKGHSDHVQSVSFSPNSQILASGSNDKTIRLWEVSTGKQKLCLEGHSQKVKTVCFSPNGQILASGSGDFTIRLWEVNTGKQKQWLEGHFSRVNSLSFCPNGKILASSGSGVSTVHLWEVNTEKEKQYLQGHSQTANSVSFGPNGQIFASGSEDGTIRVWEVNTGKEKLCLEEHSGGVNSVCFSPNGQILASGSEDKTIRLWDVSTGKQKLCLEGHSEHVKSVCFSPNDEILASGGSDNTIRLWETNTGKQKQCLEGGVESVCFSPNGELLASVTSGDIINLWIVSTGKEKQYLPWHRLSGKCFSFSPNSQILAAGSEGGTICLWEVNTGKDKLCLEGGVESVRFSPNGQILASISYDTICLSEVETGISLFMLPTRLFLFTAIDWAKNSNEDLIVAGGNLILYFKLVWDKFNKVRLRLVRSFGYLGSLAIYNVNLKDVQGLAGEQIKLLQQKKELFRAVQ